MVNRVRRNKIRGVQKKNKQIGKSKIRKGARP